MDDDAQLSIGALSRATGVPTQTLRTWERRYGAPSAVRTPTGHRRYSMATVERIRMVAQALELGHKPSTTLTIGPDALRKLLGQTAAPVASASPAVASPPLEVLELQRWFLHVERYESRGLERELRAAWSELGAIAFLESRVAPFLTELGNRWASGALGVRHEHFASERLREFLTEQWRPLGETAAGSVYVLATLPGEMHVIGLHMVAVMVGASGGRPVFLGADCPTDEIARAAREHVARAVMLSSAQGADAAAVRGHLDALRAALDPGVELCLGGHGFDGFVDPVAPLPGLRPLVAWLQARGTRI